MEPSEMPALTGIRGLAALMVFFYHLPWLARLNSNGGPACFCEGLEGLDAGVGLFFTLSAFLLSMPFWLRIAKGQTNYDTISPFLIHRLFRIFPAYLLVVGFSLLFDERTWTAWGFVNLVFHLAALQTYFHQNFIWSINNVLWTVSIEVQFYLSLAIAFAIADRFHILRFWKGLPLLALMILLGLLSDPIFRQTVVSIAPYVPAPVFGGGDPQSPVYSWNFFYFSKWFLPGMAMAWLGVALSCYNGAPLPRTHSWLREAAMSGLLLAATVIIVNAGEGEWRKYSWIGWPSNVIVFSGLVFFAPLSRLGRFLFDGVLLRWLGTVSYGLYLWHVPVLSAIGRGSLGTQLDGWPRLFAVGFAGLAVTSLLAYLSYTLLERPAILAARRYRSLAELIPPLWSSRRPAYSLATRQEGL